MPDMKRQNIKEGITNILESKTILIVEDDDFIFNLLEVMLTDTGINMMHAGDGEIAIELVKNNRVDLILLDIRLPGENGFEIFEKIRKMKSQIPVVAQTANHIPEERDKFLKAGFNDYLTKPIDYETIHSLIYKLIGN
ncbi:MAG TPA: response regulator [Bacteroidales bacterium]|nr:response regulator [Bacteroidales bacterium]